MITEERKEELNELFWAEADVPWTQEWREELTAEESALIDDWDKKYEQGIFDICSAILDIQKRREQNQL